MADANGGTTDGEQEQKAPAPGSEGDGGSGSTEEVVKLSKAELAQMVKDAAAEGNKQGEAKAHAKFQSQADKQVNQVRSESDSEIERLRKQLYERMSPEEQDREDRRRLEEKLDRLATGAKQPSSEKEPGDKGSPSEATESGDRAAAIQKQVRDNTANALKKAGLDPESVTIDGDIDTFIDSLKKAAVAAAEKERESATKAEDEDKRRNGVPSVKSGGGSGFDIKADPKELMRQAARDSLGKP